MNVDYGIFALRRLGRRTGPVRVAVEAVDLRRTVRLTVCSAGELPRRTVFAACSSRGPSQFGLQLAGYPIQFAISKSGAHRVHGGMT